MTLQKKKNLEYIFIFKIEKFSSGL